MADPPPSKKSWSLARAVRVASNGAASPQATPPGAADASPLAADSAYSESPSAGTKKRNWKDRRNSVEDKEKINEPNADAEEEFDFRPFPAQFPAKKTPGASPSAWKGRRSSNADEPSASPAASNSSMGSSPGRQWKGRDQGGAAQEPEDALRKVTFVVDESPSGDKSTTGRSFSSRSRGISTVSAAKSEYGQDGIASGRGVTSELVDQLRAVNEQSNLHVFDMATGDSTSLSRFRGESTSTMCQDAYEDRFGVIFDQTQQARKRTSTYAESDAVDGRPGQERPSDAPQRLDTVNSASSNISEIQRLTAPTARPVSSTIASSSSNTLEPPRGDAHPSASSNVSEVGQGAARPSSVSDSLAAAGQREEDHDTPSAPSSAPRRNSWRAAAAAETAAVEGSAGPSNASPHDIPSAPSSATRRNSWRAAAETAAVEGSAGPSNASSGPSAGLRDNIAEGNASSAPRKAETPKQKMERLQSENTDLRIQLLSEQSRAYTAEDALAALMQKIAGGDGGPRHSQQGAGAETVDDGLAQPQALLGRFNEEAAAEQDAELMELRERLRSFEEAAMERRFDEAPESVGKRAPQVAEVAELREEVQCLRRENNRLESQQQEVAKLHEWLQSTYPDTPVITPRGNDSISEIKSDYSVGTVVPADFHADSFEIELTEEQRQLQDLTTIIEHEINGSELQESCGGRGVEHTALQQDGEDARVMKQELLRLKTREEELIQGHERELGEFMLALETLREANQRLEEQEEQRLSDSQVGNAEAQQRSQELEELMQSHKRELGEVLHEMSQQLQEKEVRHIEVSEAEAKRWSKEAEEVELRWSRELAELREARIVELQKHREEVQMEKVELRDEIQASREQRVDSLQWELDELRDALIRVESDNERLQLESVDLGNLQDDNRRLEVAELELLALRNDLQLVETERQDGSRASGIATRVLTFETQEVARLHEHSATWQAECQELQTECKVFKDQSTFPICEAGKSRLVSSISQGAQESQDSWSLEARVKVLNAELQMQKDNSRSTHLQDTPRTRSRSVPTLPDLEPLQRRLNQMEKATQTHARVRSASQQRSEPGEPEAAELQIEIGLQPAQSELEAADFQRLVAELQDARQRSEEDCAFDSSRHEAITEEVRQLRCEHQMLEDRVLELPRLQIALDKSQADSLRLAPLEEEVFRLNNAAIESQSTQADLNCDLDKAHIALERMESRVEQFSWLEPELDRLQTQQDRVVPLEAEVAILRHTLQSQTEEQRAHRNSAKIDIDVLAPLQQQTAELQGALEQSQLACRKLEGNVQELSVLHSELDEVRADNLRLAPLESKVDFFAEELESAHLRMVKFAPLEQEVAELRSSRKEAQSAHEAIRGELQDLLGLQPELERLQTESLKLAPLEEELVQLRHSAEESQSVHLRMDGFMQELSALQPMLNNLRLENLRLLPLEQETADLRHALGESQVAHGRMEHCMQELSALQPDLDRLRSENGRLVPLEEELVEIRRALEESEQAYFGMASVNQAKTEEEVMLRESLEALRNENQRFENQEQELVELRYTMSSIQVDISRMCPAEHDVLEDVKHGEALRRRLKEEGQELAELRQATTNAVHAEFRSTQEELRQKTHEVEMQAQELAAMRISPRPNWSSPIPAEEPSWRTFRSLQSLPRSPDGSPGGCDCIEHPHQLVNQVLQSLDAMQANLPEDYAEELIPVGTRKSDQSAVVALHIHIYMRKAESNRLSGTFMYLFV